MSTKIGKKGKNPGSVDSWLDTLDLYRKNVAYDETCLFRAISEQLYDCQVHHERVRRECISFARDNFEQFIDILGSKEEFFEHMNKLEKHMVVCGDLELLIISKKYNRNITIFDAAEQQIYHFTKSIQFLKTFLLCLMDRDHYDVVYKKEHINTAGFCQSIVYKILYEDVFKIAKVDDIVHNMLYDKGNIITQAELLIEKKRMLEESGSDDFGADSMEETDENKLSAVNIAPFPFKIAKALDPNIYRNIEYDSWGEMRREWRLGDWYYGDNKLILGTKCIYNDANNGEIFDCYIQQIIKSENKCVIYLTKLAEKRTVRYSDLSPENDAKPWPLPYRFSKSVVISPTTPPPEKNAVKLKKRNKDKKRTKSESSVLSSTTMIRHEPLVDNVDAYVGVPLQMQSPSSSENTTYTQTEVSTETQTDPLIAQNNVLPAMMENQMDGSRWYANGYQWQPYAAPNVAPFVWPASPTINQNGFNYNLKPMVASAPVIPSVVPYHDSNYPYYYNYQVETYPQWSSPAPFELQPPPPPRNQPEKPPEQEATSPTNNAAGQSGVTQNMCKVEVSETINSIPTPERPTLMFSHASETPGYTEQVAPCTPIEMYSPMSPVVQLPAGPVIYTTAPPEMTEVVMPTTPVIYGTPLEVPYMPSSPFIYPPTPPPTWYPAGITPQGFIFPPRP